jgi:hypothetical protein
MPPRKKKGIVEKTLFSDTESEGEVPVARMEPMRHDSTFMAGGRIRRTTNFVDVFGSPIKRARAPEADFLVPDIAPDPGDGYGQREDFTPTDGFEFDEGHPLDKGPRDLRDSVSFGDLYLFSL